MKRVATIAPIDPATTVSRLKDNLSAYLNKVRAGHAVVIYDRGVPIARLERIASNAGSPDRPALLRARGLLRPPTRSLNAKPLRSALKTAPRKARLADALSEEREEAR